MRVTKTIENEMGLPVTLQEIQVTISTCSGDMKYRNVVLVFDQVTNHTDSEGSVCLELNREQCVRLAEYLIEFSGGTLAGKK